VAGDAGTDAEMAARQQAERSGEAFLIVRDGVGAQVIVVLERPRAPYTVGRGEGADVRLAWDDGVSRTHALLERIGDAWVLVDEGLSRNGSWVNGERLAGRRRLRDGDHLRFGETVAAFREPITYGDSTRRVVSDAREVAVTPAQKRVLVALCRPFLAGSPVPRPASNEEIAGELYLSLAAVKTHLRNLFDLFEVEDAPQRRKRFRLVERALETGAVTERDLA